MQNKTPWPGAITAAAGMGATCFAMHTDHLGFAIWFSVLTFISLALSMKALSD